MLIGLHGRKQAGKDTVYHRAAHIMRDVVRVERASFADLLYESAAAAIGQSADFLRYWKAHPDAGLQIVTPLATSPQIFVTFREYLQFYGTEAHRQVFGDNFWVEQLQLADHDRRIVMVTDVRFANEAKAVRDAGGVVVCVVGPDEIEHAGDGHASETPLPDYAVNAWIKNKVRDDNFRTLDGQVDTLLRMALNGQL